MEFEHLLIRITESFHQSLQKYKEETLNTKEFQEITLSQLFYIEAIFQLGNPTLSELAKKLGVSKASVTIAVNRLCENKLARKVQSNDDQRVFNISLTDNGKRLVNAELKSLSGFADKIKKSLNEKEFKQLHVLFSKIVNHNIKK